MQTKGVLHTIDIKEELVDFQRKYFDKSVWGNQIFQHLGEAVDIIPNLKLKFDLVFIDADKENYINYFHLIIPKMNKGGIILVGQCACGAARFWKNCNQMMFLQKYC